MRTVAEADIVVGKLVAYDGASAAWADGVLLVADENDADYDFEGHSAELRNGARRLHRRPRSYKGQPGTIGAREEIRHADQPGPADGELHGTRVDLGLGARRPTCSRATMWRRWTNAPRLPIVIAMNCLNGSSLPFIRPKRAWRSAAARGGRRRGGRVGLVESDGRRGSGGGEPGALHWDLPGNVRDAWRSDGGGQAGHRDRDVRRSWILFGDPAMRLPTPD